tara:strand:- start:3305 stop:3901 length:597 start_codon:yes stop_codon:yes gene_type:complete
MTATFQSLRDTRLPKATKAVSLLGNLVRYAHTEQEAKDLVNEISDAVDDVDAAFAKKWGWVDEPAVTPMTVDKIAAIKDELVSVGYVPVPQGTAEGGAEKPTDAEIEKAIAYDKHLAEDPPFMYRGVPVHDVATQRRMMIAFKNDSATLHTGVPQGTAEGGATFEAEVRWALDAIRRGDKKLAEDRLTRILKGQADEG